MKILVLSLLRIGDSIMHSSIIDAFRERYPHAKIEILANEISLRYFSTCKNIDHTIEFPRTRLQNFIVEENRPILRAKSILQDLVNSLNETQYDLVVNLTHNKLSARLMDLLQAKKKVGISYHDKDSNSWLHFLNESYSTRISPPFHYLEATAASVGIKNLSMPHVKNQSGSRICMQILTSDEKKNWPIKNFLELASLLGAQFKNKTVTILGAPSEENSLHQLFLSVPNLDYQFLSWKELPNILKDTCLLITGDTSVQHLAAQVGTPILSLFSGSANPYKTAPYLEGAILMQSKVSCTPCSHSQSCIKNTIECAEQIGVNDVYQVAEALIRKISLPKTQCKLFKVTKRQGSRFHLTKVGGNFEMINFQSALEQTVWEMYLSEDYLNEVASFGVSTYQLMEEFVRPFSTSEIKYFLHERLQKCEMDQICSEEIHHLILENAKLGAYYGDVQNYLTNYLLRNRDSADYFHLMQEVLRSEDVGFSLTKRLSFSNREASILLKIENKLIHTLIHEINEREMRYGKGFRAAFASSASTS